MSYTFGASDNNSISATTLASLGATGNRVIYAGWFYPTTLTAGRNYFSFGNAASGIAVNTDTTELRLRQLRTTTTGEYTTTGAGITTNKWFFIAAYAAGLSSPASEFWQAWIGTEESPPAAVTTTPTVSPAGSMTSSTNLIMGNSGTSGAAAQAFQGDIASFMRILSSTNSADNAALIPTANYLSPTASELSLMLDTIILPLWTNGSIGQIVRSQGVYSLVSEINIFDLSTFGNPFYRFQPQNASANTAAMQFNGTPAPVFTANNPGRPVPTLKSIMQPHGGVGSRFL